MFNRNAIVFASVMLGLGLVIMLASLRGEPQPELAFDVTSEAHHVDPERLAKWIIEGRRDFALIDMRDEKSYAAAHIQGAVHCGSCHESKEEGNAAQQGDQFVDLSKKLVFYTQTDRETVSLPRILRDNPRMYRLAGGYDAWEEKILAPVSFADARTEEQLAARRKTEAVRAYFSGERPAPTHAKLSIEPIRRRNAHKPKGSDEGC